MQNLGIRSRSFEDKIQAQANGHKEELVAMFERWTQGGYSQAKGKGIIHKETQFTGNPKDETKVCDPSNHTSEAIILYEPCGWRSLVIS